MRLEVGSLRRLCGDLDSLQHLCSRRDAGQQTDAELLRREAREQ